MKEVKACVSYNCERTLPASSKHTRCARCRKYDKNAASRSPRWLVERFTNVSRWGSLLVELLPKKERANANIRAIAPSNGNHSRVEQIRKRA